MPGDFTWDDIGDFDSLAELLTVDTLGDEGVVLRVDADGAFVVPGSGRTVSVVGLPDAVVVDTPDAVLVTTRAHAQSVKAAVDGLARPRSGRPPLTRTPSAPAHRRG